MSLEIIAIAIGFGLGFNLILFLIAYLLQTDKLTDLSYSTTYLVIASIAYYLYASDIHDLIVFSLILCWAIRLGSYLFIRIHKMGRDERFDGIREKLTSFMAFWVMQGLTCGIVSLPFVFIFMTPTEELSLSHLLIAGVAVIGLILESVADHQKYVFKSANKDCMMTSGLWKHIRHPNYLGELIFWWSIFLFALFIDGPVWLIVSPLWITMILLRFSGIPILERKWHEKYGKDVAFKTYWKNTYRLIPGIY